MIFETFLSPLIFSRATIGRLGNHYFSVLYVRAARKVFPYWSQKKKTLFMIISHCFTVMVSNQLAFRVPFLRFPNYLRMLCLKMAHLGRVAYCFEPMLFRHANLYFSTIISMRTQEVCIKTRPTSASPSIKARVLTRQLKNGLLEATLLGPLLPPRNSSSCYFDTVKYVFASPIWAIPL